MNTSTNFAEIYDYWLEESDNDGDEDKNLKGYTIPKNKHLTHACQLCLCFDFKKHAWLFGWLPNPYDFENKSEDDIVEHMYKNDNLLALSSMDHINFNKQETGYPTQTALHNHIKSQSISVNVENLEKDKHSDDEDDEFENGSQNTKEDHLASISPLAIVSFFRFLFVFVFCIVLFFCVIKIVFLNENINLTVEKCKMAGVCASFCASKYIVMEI